jgi:transposase
VAELKGALAALCGPEWLADSPPLEGLDDDYRLLVNEVMRLREEELFTFVTAKPVEQTNGASQAVGPTNNEAERTLRNPAEARKTGRTSKTMHGARRQTVVMSVLESLRLYLTTWTLPNVIEEVRGWMATGRSCFERRLEEMGLARSGRSILDEILPSPSG